MRQFISLSFMILVLFTSIILADSVKFRNGDQVEGTYVGGDSRTVRFLLENGQMETYSIEAIDRIIFGASAISIPTPRAVAPSRTLPSSTAGSGGSPQVDTVVAETPVVVRMIDPIDSDEHSPGDTFRASLEEPLMVGEQTVATRYSPATVQLVHVEQSGQLRGEEEIALQLRSITINDKTYTVNTRFAELASEGKGSQTAKVVGGTTAIGAIIGAIAGGKKGAAIGAASGAGAGVAVQSLRGKTVKVPPETVLTFRLDDPLVIH